MTAVEILVGARELVRQGWTRGTFARNSFGKPCVVFCDDAVAWCCLGALCKASGGCYSAEYKQVLSVLNESVSGPLSDWNDEASYGEVIAHLDETIATLRSREEISV